MNGIDQERRKCEESPSDFDLRHEARQYRKGYFTGLDLASGPNITVNKCLGCDAQWIEGEKPRHAFGCGAAETVSGAANDRP